MRRKLVIPVLLTCIMLTGCAGGNSEGTKQNIQTDTVDAEDNQTAEDNQSAEDAVDVKVEEEAPEPEPEPEPVPATELFDNLKERVNETVFPSTAGKLKVVGPQLCDQNGEPVQLRGVSTHGIQWFPEYVNQELFNELHNDWNVNAVRLAMYTIESEGYCADGNKDEIKQTMCDGIEYAKNADIYAIVDWHTMRDGDPSTYTEEAITFFDEMSEKYADYDNVIYEICNEPNTVTWAVIREYAMKVIPVIREHDPDAVILIGTPIYCKAPTEPSRDIITEYDNIMYTCHFYAASHHETIQTELKRAVDMGLPVFVSEFGICSNTGTGSLDVEWGDSWIDLCDENGISYMCWQLSNKHESSSLITEECTKTSGFNLEELSEQGQWLREKYSR